MTVAQMAKLIESKWMLSDGKGLRFIGTVIDMREVWGKPQCKVSPVDGHGERWVDMTSLSAPKA